MHNILTPTAPYIHAQAMIRRTILVAAIIAVVAVTLTASLLEVPLTLPLLQVNAAPAPVTGDANNVNARLGPTIPVNIGQHTAAHTTMQTRLAIRVASSPLHQLVS